MNEPPGRGTVALLSAAVLNCLAEDVETYAAALFAGRSGIAPTGERMPSEARAPVGGWLRDFDLEGWIGRHLADDRAAARLRHAAARCALPAQSAACVAVLALRDAGLDERQTARTAVLVAGSNLALDYQVRTAWQFRQTGRVTPSHALTHMDIDTVGAVSEATGACGEGWVLGASAASGSLAAIQAVRLLEAGEVDHCLVVGPCSELSPLELRALHDSGALARSTPGADPATVCRPFDADRSGLVYGQGAAAVLLTRLAPAAPALARLPGFGLGLDGARGMEPHAAGQAAAMRAALDRARLPAGAVGYVNAHAAGTVVGDRTEAQAIHEVFGAGPLVNSTKALTGHCFGSAGLMELVATALQLRERRCHPNPNLYRPCHPGLRFAPRTAVPLPAQAALTNGQGVSGISSSIAVTRPASYLRPARTTTESP
ncbi:beta-ketoacyl synthase N-terminal-like domain-containing protein [Kitasatospora sp. NPDC088134]|uniref:beta-ketoacyl synthase N-terminal-like domain-containing protein n=1 Tax=Kitasatospora sp. NPDC088134 TaxID=3364071 RepID=UPI003822BAF8